jgi:hypothetical protein
MEDPRLDASVLVAELPIYKQEAQALIWLSYSVLGVRRDFDLRVESRRGRSYGTPPVAGRRGSPEVRVCRPQSERPVRKKFFPFRTGRASCVVIGASTERPNRPSRSSIDGPKVQDKGHRHFLSFRGQRKAGRMKSKSLV